MLLPLENEEPTEREVEKGWLHLRCVGGKGIECKAFSCGRLMGVLYLFFVFLTFRLELVSVSWAR